MRKRLAFLSLMSLVVNCSEAAAQAINEEVVRHPSLLMLGGITQFGTVSYGYTGHTTLGRTSSSQDLSEGYGISTEAAVLSPDILLLQLAAGVSYQQQLSKTGSKLLNYNYNLVGNAFQLSNHPILVASSRTSSTVSSGYTPSYTLDRTSQRISGSFLHEILPLRLYYTHATVATSGLAVDTTGSTDSAGISGHHDIGTRSSTDASLSWSTSDSEGRESRSYSTFVLNRFTIDAQKRYQLVTKASLADNISSDIPQRQGNLSATLTSRLGQALTTTVSDQYSYSSTVDFQNNEQVVKTNAIAAGLSHRLYQSLNTGLSGSIGHTSALGGTESSYNMTLILAYRKILPAQSNLAVNVNASRTVTKQDFRDTLLSARDEPHLVNQGDQVTPALTGKLLRVLSVVRLDPDNPAVILQTYIEGTDYIVHTDTGKIEIVVNGGIGTPTDATPTLIHISYEVATNQNLDFEGNSQGYQAILNLLGGRYTVTADYAQSDQKRISGIDQNLALVDSKSFNLRGEAHYTNTSFGAEYGTVTSTQESLSRLGATWTWDTFLFSTGTLRLNARELYTMYGASATSKAYDENLATLSVSYTRTILDGIRLLIASNVSDSRRGGNSSDMLMLRAGLDGNFNRLVVSMSAQSTYRLSQGGDSRDDSFHFKITRYF